MTNVAKYSCLGAWYEMALRHMNRMNAAISDNVKQQIAAELNPAQAIFVMGFAHALVDPGRVKDRDIEDWGRLGELIAERYAAAFPNKCT